MKQTRLVASLRRGGRWTASSARRKFHGQLPTLTDLADTDLHILRAGHFRLFVIVASGDLILGAIGLLRPCETRKIVRAGSKNAGTDDLPSKRKVSLWHALRIAGALGQGLVKNASSTYLEAPQHRCGACGDQARLHIKKAP